jgi:DNA polymerase-3 subunit delta
LSETPIHLLNGDDGALLSEAMTKLVDTLVGDGDKTLLVADHSSDDYAVEHVVDAARTLPFLTDRRIVVARGAERFTADELGPLVSYLDDPSPTSTIIVEWGGGRIPKKFADAVKACGGVKVATAAPHQARARQSWLDERLADSPVALEPRAKRAIAERLGEDVGRLGGLLAVLESTFGPGVALSEDDVEPFLGQSGSAPTWDLTDALDKGDITTALRVLGRLLDGGGRHPLQIMASLHSHYERMLKLDGSGVRDEKAAAQLLGMKGSTFPAKKALTQARRLGSDPIFRAIGLLAAADLDLKGDSGLEASTVIEVLVARLAQLAARR